MILCKSFHVKHIGLSSCFCNLENNHFALLNLMYLQKIAFGNSKSFVSLPNEHRFKVAILSPLLYTTIWSIYIIESCNVAHAQTYLRNNKMKLNTGAKT
jgi:hypothetical protein